MAVAGVLVKLFTTFLPLIKEYITSSDKRKDILSLRTMSAWVIISLVIGTGCALYLAEQAVNNLTLHEPLIKQYTKIQQENQKLKSEQSLLKKTIATYKEETRTALSICSIQDPVTVAPAQEYVYDPKSHTMVLTGEIKK
jgi:hypothetical protein